MTAKLSLEETAAVLTTIKLIWEGDVADAISLDLKRTAIISKVLGMYVEYIPVERDSLAAKQIQMLANMMCRLFPLALEGREDGDMSDVTGGDSAIRGIVNAVEVLEELLKHNS